MSERDATRDGAGPRRSIPPARRLTRRALVGGTAGALATSAVWSVGPGRSPTAASRQADPTAEATIAAPEVPAFSEEEVEAVVVALAEAGIAVYTDPDATTPLVPVPSPGPLALLRSQVRTMVLEATNRAGLLGADLDALVTTGPGTDEAPSLPASPFLAGYLAADTPGARLARRFVAPPAAADAADAVYPGLVLALFAAELARESVETAGAGLGTDHVDALATQIAASEADGAPPTPPPEPTAESARRAAAPLASSRRALVPAAQGGVCSAVQSFIDRTLNALFSALQVDLGNSVPGRILGEIINFALDAAQTAVRAVLRELTAPVLNVIKTIAGVIGTVSTAVSILRPWSLRMTPNPASTRLAVGSEPPIPGDVACGVDLGGLDEWPADLADCAAQSGAPLPPLKPTGARCTWEVVQSRLVPLVLVREQPAALDDNATATLAYVTVSESPEVARGTPVNGWVRVTLNVTRPEIDDLRRTLSNLLFAQLPTIVAQFARPILGPVVDDLLARLATLADTRSSVIVPVLYHEKKEEEPTPPPDPDPDPEGGAATIEATFSQGFANAAAGVEIEFKIEIAAGTCDGDSWEGTMRSSAMGVAAVFLLDMDDTLPIAWSFAGGDEASTTVGPFTGDLTIQQVSMEPVAATYEVTITRERDAAGQTATLSFGFVVTSAEFFDTGRLSQYTNLNTPLPVNPGNPDC